MKGSLYQTDQSIRITGVPKNHTDLKFISLNIEGSKHLDLVLPFLDKEKPDVFCAQELFESDIPIFKAKLGMECAFAPLCRWDQDGERPAPELFGDGIFSRKPIKNVSVIYYLGDADSIPLHTRGKSETVYCALSSGEILKDGQVFAVSTTHFVWTPNGEADGRQRQALVDLFKAMETRPDIILSGDFNAPRGSEIFDAIAARYKDNIPAEYKTSIDGKIHRTGPLPYMVDGLFTTPGYIAEDTRLIDGLSDHMAIISRIRKAA
jgi:exonuclease III